MKKTMLVALALLLAAAFLTTGCTAQPQTGSVSAPQPPEPDPVEYVSALEPAPAAPEGFDIAAVLEYLCSTAFGGRQTGTGGCAAAGDYAAAFLEEWGYQPLFGDSLAVPYTAVVGDPALAQAEVILHLPGGDITLTQGVDYTFSFHVEDIDATLPISTDPAACAEGEAVLLWTKDVNRDNAKITLMQADGILNSGSDVLGLEGSNLEDRRITLSDNAFALAVQATEITLRLKANAKEMERNNYCAVLPGADRTQAMVLCAHIDGTGTWGDILYPSAHDNASGTVTLLECARQLAGRPLPYDLVFCIFTGEEQHLTGSKALAPVLEEHYDLVNVINLDCLGCGEPESLKVLGKNNAALSKALEIYLRAVGYVGMEYAVAASDQDAFTHPAIGLSETPAEGIRFHQPNDTVDTVDPAWLEKIADMVCTYVRNADMITMDMEAEARQELGAVSIKGIVASGEMLQQQSAAREAQRQKLTAGFAYDQAICDYATVNGKSVNALFTGWRMLESLEEVQQYYPDLELPETVDEKPLFGVYVVHDQGAVFTEGGSQWAYGQEYTVDWESQPVDSMWAYYIDNSGGFFIHVGGSTYDRAGHPSKGRDPELSGEGYAYRGTNGKFSGIWYMHWIEEAEDTSEGIYWKPKYGQTDEEHVTRVRDEVKDTLEHLTVWYGEHKGE